MAGMAAVTESIGVVIELYLPGSRASRLRRGRAGHRPGLYSGCTPESPPHLDPPLTSSRFALSAPRIARMSMRWSKLTKRAW